MNSLIERYIYDVTRRLPEASRADVKKELNVNISDMLPEKHTEEDVKKVLISLGEPRILANGYRTKQRYLISPEKMDDYLRILKIVLIVFGSISLVFGMIDAILHLEATTGFGVFIGIVVTIDIIILWAKKMNIQFNQQAIVICNNLFTYPQKSNLFGICSDLEYNIAEVILCKQKHLNWQKMYSG